MTEITTPAGRIVCFLTSKFAPLAMRSFAAALLALPVVGGTLLAQTQAAVNRPLVTIALTTTPLAAGNRATVIRRVAADPGILVLLDAKTATAADLASALGALARSLSRHPESWGTQELRIQVTRSAFHSSDPSQAANVDRLLERVRGAPSRVIEGYGTLRAITIPAPVLAKHPTA